MSKIVWFYNLHWTLFLSMVHFGIRITWLNKQLDKSWQNLKLFYSAFGRVSFMAKKPWIKWWQNTFWNKEIFLFFVKDGFDFVNVVESSNSFLNSFHSWVLFLIHFVFAPFIFNETTFSFQKYFYYQLHFLNFLLCSLTFFLKFYGLFKINVYFFNFVIRTSIWVF